VDKRFLKYYRDELAFIRELGAEFAQSHPKIAGRLGIDHAGKDECADPFVERMLEGFAFLTARVSLKLDAEFPRASQGLLETVLPQYLSPVPSMAIAQVEPDFDDSNLAAGYPVKRGTDLRCHKARDEYTACRFRTAHDVTLWPIRITQARYLTKDIGILNLSQGKRAPAAFLLRLECAQDIPFNQLDLDHLDLYVRSDGGTTSRILEQLFARAVHVGFRTPKNSNSLQLFPADGHFLRIGYTKEESLLPNTPQMFEGYRLLREYFAFPERFNFVRINGLRSLLSRFEEHELELVVTFDQQEPMLEQRLDEDTFQLNCTPIINLFRQRTDRIQLTDRYSEYPVIVDKTHSLDYEIFSINKVTGFGDQSDIRLDFQPFYLTRDTSTKHRAYYTLRRARRVLSSREKTYGKVSSYTGSEVYMSLVDTQQAPFPREIRELSVEALCTNRHLPIHINRGNARGDFVPLEGPIAKTVILDGPTEPIASLVEGDLAWRLISHLSLNYFSLSDNEGGATALRNLLKLYAFEERPELAQYIDGLHSIQTYPINRRLPIADVVTFGRGLEVTVTFDETQFEGTGIFVFGSILDFFFRKYVSLNSFTETVIVSEQRGEIKRWPLQIGNAPLL